MGKTNKGDSPQSNPNADIAYDDLCVHVKLYYISRWLSANRSKLFKRKAARNQNYVAVKLNDSIDNGEPKLYYLSAKVNVQQFIKNNPLSVFQYRYSNRMQLMF